MDFSKILNQREPKSHKSTRVLLLGATGVGKTSLINDVIGECSGDCKKYQPTIWDSRESVIDYNGKALNVTFIEPGGLFLLRDMLRLSVKDSDIFILVYSVDDPKSKAFIPPAIQAISEIKGKHINSLPILIVGNKLDTVKSLKGLNIFDNAKNGAFEKDKRLYKWSKNQVKVSHKYQVNTDIIKEGIFYLREKYF